MRKNILQKLISSNYLFWNEETEDYRILQNPSQDQEEKDFSTKQVATQIYPEKSRSYRIYWDEKTHRL